MMMIRSSLLLLLLPLLSRGDQGLGDNSGFGGGDFDGFDQDGMGGMNGMDGMGGIGGMDQGDDLFGSLGASATSMLMLMGGQCLDGIDLDAMMENPFQAADEKCDSDEAQKFNSALDDFKACAGFNLHDLIESFGSVLIGLGINCGSYFTGISEMLDGEPDIEKLMGNESPVPRVPADCVATIAGDNPFARAFLQMEEHPEKEMKCFADLAENLPKCKLNEWPIPIVGSWLSAISCLYGSMGPAMQPMIAEQCQKEFATLSACLPEDINESDCHDTLNSCVFNLGGDPSLNMALPPPFWAPPLSEQCKQVGESDYASVMERYETFRSVCIPADDRSVWDISPQDSSGGGASEMLASTGRGESPAPPSSSSKFMPGVFTGMIVVCVAMFGFKKMRGGSGSSGPSNKDYSFDSLELSQSPPRGDFA